jgi:hypothetical protein
VADRPYRSLSQNCQFRPFGNKKRVLAVSNRISFEPHCSLQYTGHLRALPQGLKSGFTRRFTTRGR